MDTNSTIQLPSPLEAGAYNGVGGRRARRWDLTETEKNGEGNVRGGTVRMAVSYLGLGAILFATAGTFSWWQAWMYWGGLLLPLAAVAAWMVRRSPDLFRRRLAGRESDPYQKRLRLPWGICILLVFVVPGLDFRFGWSQVPAALSLLAEAGVLLGYGFVFLVFRENRHASAVIRVEAEQRVVKTGPYAVVRHPMYLGMTAMYLLTPLALGSWWALLPAAGMPAVLALRIRDEERVLLRDLPGYAAYREETRHRLIPGIW